MKRLDLASAAIVLLVLFAIAHAILPAPWGSFVGAAAFATIAALALSRLWPATTSPSQGTAPGDDTAAAGAPQMRANVADMIDAYQLAGFDEDDAKRLVRDQLLAQAPNPSHLRSVKGDA